MIKGHNHCAVSLNLLKISVVMRTPTKHRFALCAPFDIAAFSTPVTAFEAETLTFEVELLAIEK
jgi:hypothetical protein